MIEVLTMENEKLHKVREIDFKTLHPSGNLDKVLENAFEIRTKYLPTAIEAATTPPKHMVEER